MSRALDNKLTEIIEPAVAALGLVLWGCEFVLQGRHAALRVYIERPDGTLQIGDCEQVSRQISAILDVEDPIHDQYNLEVSSPGMDRALFDKSQYKRYIGSKIKIRLHQAIGDRRNFTGVLLEVNDETFGLNVDDEQLTIHFNQVEKANLVPVF